MRPVLPARMCRNERPTGARSHAARRVRLDAERPVRGLGYPNKLHGDIENGIPMPCLLILSEIFDKKWTWVGAVPIDHPVSFPQKSRCHSDIMDIGSGGLYRVDKATPGVHACVALHAKMPLVPLLHRVHLRIPFFLCVFCGTGCADQRGIHNGAAAHHPSGPLQTAADCVKKQLADAFLLQQVPEVQQSGGIRNIVDLIIHSYR